MFDAHEMPVVPGELPVSHSMPLPAQGPQSVHLLDRLNAVFKHRRLVIGAFLLIFLASAGAAILRPRHWRAST